MVTKRVAVVAIGGNSLIKDKYHQTVPDQYGAIGETCDQIAAMIKEGWDVVITHGNGPQVGFILRRSELAAHELHEVPLDVCVADTQGAIGYALQQNLYNDFRQLNINKAVATVVTQVEVKANDPAFQTPNKPIGSFMDAEEAKRRTDEGWNVFEDAGRGWRRVVASPVPLRIIETPVIQQLIDAGVVVIAVGGGGIPAVTDNTGNLTGVAAVIDKDHASALLAKVIGADVFIVSTTVEKVALNFGKPEQEWLQQITLVQAKRYLSEGIHFGKGSMEPKIEAAVSFIESGGERAIITNPENITRALSGLTGTHITR
ncbi:MAG TPA: carbamate kinase [Candidatus Limnocylindrales bacterium]|nr:carbamate kinase [Candidatus Limnocylindrales bacterium]